MTQTNPEQWAVEVREVETVTGDFGTEPGTPFYRIEIGGYCADFDCREGAQNFANAIQAAFAEREAQHIAMEKRARDLSIMIVQHLGGGSEWFSRVGAEYYADPKAISPELQRRKTDAQITKSALVRANRANAEQAEREARLVALLKRAQEIMPGPYIHWHDDVTAALKDRTHG